MHSKRGAHLVVCRATYSHIFCHYSDGTMTIQRLYKVRKNQNQEQNQDQNQTTYEPTIESRQYIADALTSYDSAKLRAERASASSIAVYRLAPY